ncbi:ribulose-phosphate 3-epimerase [Spiroplasma endosymbiont of Dasysyrphus albostriatus]|uniref:ribulose-phosphate 3-epimerase n=1 Tax=Spiroplasma endosymbiont of Dasysyrphus albostriatus TaxID=3066299 RepID=UPI0030D0D7E6
MKKEVTIAASILTANFLSLKDDLLNLQNAGINWIHFDVMDHHFVENLSFGAKILSDVCKFSSNINIDCHMMVKITTSKVCDYLKPFIILPQVKNINLHYEALTEEQLKEFLQWKNPGFKKGIAINPDTPISKIYDYLKDLDTILIMSVQPGAGGQRFLDLTINKIKMLVKHIDNNFPNITIAVDGGINNLTANDCIAAGANYLVAGSYLLNSDNSVKKQVAMLTNYEK